MHDRSYCDKNLLQRQQVVVVYASAGEWGQQQGHDCIYILGKKRVTFDRLTLYHFNQHNKNNQNEDRGCQTCKLTSKVLYLSQPRLSTSPTTQRNRRSRVLAPSFVNGRNNGSYGSSRFSFVSSMNVRQGKFKIEKYMTWIQCHHYF